jgi:hypothetical protein
VIHPIKELLQIHINHPAATRRHKGSGGKYSLMSASVRAESIARFGKVAVKDYLHDLMERLLDESIYDRRNTQLPYPCAVRFGDIHTPNRTRYISTRQQLLFDTRPVLSQVRPQ